MTDAQAALNALFADNELPMSDYNGTLYDAISAVLDEDAEAYAKGQEHAGNMIWQAIKKSPDSKPDWELREWERPGGMYWLRGKERVRTDIHTLSGAPLPRPYSQHQLIPDWD